MIGLCLTNTAWPLTNVFGYAGQQLSSTSHLLMMGGYRSYNPGLGQFTKQDSFSPFSSQRNMNGFDYAAGNPVLLADPSGHRWTHADTAYAVVGGLVLMGSGGFIGSMVVDAKAGSLLLKKQGNFLEELHKDLFLSNNGTRGWGLFYTDPAPTNLNRTLLTPEQVEIVRRLGRNYAQVYQSDAGVYRVGDDSIEAFISRIDQSKGAIFKRI